MTSRGQRNFKKSKRPNILNMKKDHEIYKTKNPIKEIDDDYEEQCYPASKTVEAKDDDYDYGELADDESDEDISGNNNMKVPFKHEQKLYPTRMQSQQPQKKFQHEVYLEDIEDDNNDGDNDVMHCNRENKTDLNEILQPQPISFSAEEESYCPQPSTVKENTNDRIKRKKIKKLVIPAARDTLILNDIHDSKDTKETEPFDKVKTTHNDSGGVVKSQSPITEARLRKRLEGGRNELKNQEVTQHRDRISLDNYLSQKEKRILKEHNENFPYITPEDYNQCMSADAENIESSFNDDSVVTSEREFFSSPFSESDLEDYVPPLTRTKRALVAQLVANATDKNDPAPERKIKRKNRRDVIRNFREMLIKKRKLKAYRRLKHVLDLNLKNPEQEALLLEELELRDKKLDRPYYYEDIEPETIKKLHRKRKRAIKKKFKMYATRPKFQTDYKNRIFQDVQYAMKPPRFREQKPVQESVEKENVVEKSLKKEEQDERSSFYDTAIPESELEYFSSEWSDNGLLHPEPVSRRRDKRRRLLNRYIILEADLPYQMNRKFLKRTEIEAQFKNYCQSKKAIKAMSRLKTVRMRKYGNPCKEADELKNLEIYDKKLDRDYLFNPKELPIYHDLLEKRRRAIARKYEKYARDKEFRHKYRDKIYVNVQRIINSPYFDEDKEPESDVESESSFNDSEVPTSEEEYMSNGYEGLKPPVRYCKPITRNRKDLYDYLEKLELNVTDSENTIQYKRQLRMNAIQQFKRRLRDRRKWKAYNRLEDVKKMAINDHGIIAGQLFSMEIRDKKLDRGFLYHRKEPEVFKILLEKRIRAIQRKFEEYMRSKEFRDKYEDRIMKQWFEIRIPKYTDENAIKDDDNDEPFYKKFKNTEIFGYNGGYTV